MNISRIARICHEVNKLFCEEIGDLTQKDWELAEQWQRDSAIKGVEFAINNPELTAEDQHNAWSEDKVKDGWVYGLTKDVINKTHPCLVPYSDLPKEQQVKDQLFRSIVLILKELP